MYQQQKKVTARALWEVNLKMNLMKSYKNIKKEAAPKKTKKENAKDIISKSL